jgi:hypothetical protein
MAHDQCALDRRLERLQGTFRLCSNEGVPHRIHEVIVSGAQARELISESNAFCSFRPDGRRILVPAPRCRQACYYLASRKRRNIQSLPVQRNGLRC